MARHEIDAIRQSLECHHDNTIQTINAGRHPGLQSANLYRLGNDFSPIAEQMTGIAQESRPKDVLRQQC